MAKLFLGGNWDLYNDAPAINCNKFVELIRPIAESGTVLADGRFIQQDASRHPQTIDGIAFDSRNPVVKRAARETGVNLRQLMKLTD